MIKDPGKLRAYMRAWHAAHPHYARDYWRKRFGYKPRLTRTPQEWRVLEMKITFASCRICSADYRKMGRGVTCSPICKREYREAIEAWRLRLRHKNYGERACKVCGNSFHQKTKRHVHCSRHCFYIASERIGPPNPNGEKQWLRKAMVMNKNLRRLIRTPNADHSIWLSAAHET